MFVLNWLFGRPAVAHTLLVVVIFCFAGLLVL